MDRQYVGIDFHRRRSVVVRLSATGERLSSVRIPNDPLAIAAAVAEAGSDPEVVVEATYGWYWVVDLLQGQRRPGPPRHRRHPGGRDRRRRPVPLRPGVVLSSDLPYAAPSPSPCPLGARFY
jgi:hypothetical protein